MHQLGHTVFGDVDDAVFVVLAVLAALVIHQATFRKLGDILILGESLSVPQQRVQRSGICYDGRFM